LGYDLRHWCKSLETSFLRDYDNKDGIHLRISSDLTAVNVEQKDVMIINKPDAKL